MKKILATLASTTVLLASATTATTVTTAAIAPAEAHASIPFGIPWFSKYLTCRNFPSVCGRPSGGWA